MRLSFNFDDVKLVRQGLENLEAETPKIGRKRVYDGLMKLTREVLKRYPPKRPGQKYRRTFKFKRAWRIKRSGRDGYMIENNARQRGRTYPQWVVGNAYGQKQAWMHRGRWYVFRDVMDEFFRTLPGQAADDIHVVARRKAFKPG